MMNRLKRLLGNLTAGAISIFVLCLAITAPYQVEVHATAPGPMAYTAPSDGVGRIVLAKTEHETSVDTPEAETAEFEPYIASQAAVETEAEMETYPNLPEPTEYYQVLPDPDPIIETDIDALIVQIAGEYGLPWELVRAVCWVESRFNVYAKSDHPDFGLMQVWEQVWIDYGYDPKDPIVYDPETNLRMGCDVLKSKIDASNGDFANALTRYRFGDGGAMEKWRQGEYSNWYNESVLGKYYEYLRGEYDG